MIFLCFSGKDRMTIVRSILYHLKNYGLDVWYDNYRYILGDNKNLGYTQAITHSKYAIIVFSKNFPNSLGALEEFNIIKKQYDNNQIHIFPIFYNIAVDEIPQKYYWLTDLIYNELTEETGSLLTCNQILCKYLIDIIQQNNFKTLDILLKENLIADQYLKELLINYQLVISSNINCKLTFLSCALLYINQQIKLPQYIEKSSKFLMQVIKLGLNYNFKEIDILEYLIAISINIQNRQSHLGFE